MGKYVGIDLGTTFSAVAYIDEKGNPQIIPNKQGENITPSTVLFGGKKPIIGTVAKRKSITDPKNYEAFVKRHMGEKTYSFTTKDGETFRPEEISALILTKLKTDAEEFLGDTIEGAVITVPAYFGDPQRQATKDAASLAGLKVLDIINEPTAAAIAFGISKDVDTSQRVMIYDFGGGTFDVSILEIDADNIRVIATNGDHKLGGYDIDMAIVNYVKEQAKENGFDVNSDIKAVQNLMIQAEAAKKELSSDEMTTISFYIKGEDFSIDLDRETFEDLIETVLDTTVSVMQRTLDESKLEYNDINKILLVGGSTRIPAVQSMIEEETGIHPSSEVHPDEAVAIGAAYHAVDVVKQISDGTFKTETRDTGKAFIPSEIDTDAVPDLDKNYSFHDITSHGIGVVVYDSSTDKMVNSVVLQKNTEIPAEVIRDGYSTTSNYQEGIQLQVTQGEDVNLDYVTIIGEANLHIRPRDHIVPIRIMVSCDRDAIIHVRAIDLDENTDLGEVTINREKHNMTEEEVRKAATRINKLNIGD
ncbi:MAG: Hsp70 family protein [Lachnospiraceae bacterium]|nr:Hsp70 family protein [Lachnospiraceae bacterium]